MGYVDVKVEDTHTPSSLKCHKLNPCVWQTSITTFPEIFWKGVHLSTRYRINPYRERKEEAEDRVRVRSSRNLSAVTLSVPVSTTHYAVRTIQKTKYKGWVM